jgi:hypothetical protein
VERDLGLEVTHLDRVSALFTVLEGVKAIRDFDRASRVAAGGADYQILKDVIPHVVMAADVMAGPQHEPIEIFEDRPVMVYEDLNDRYLKVGTATVTVERQWDPTVPPGFQPYGYDPMTDRITRTTRLDHDVTITTATPGWDARRFETFTPPNDPAIRVEPPVRFDLPRFP